ncbi:unnamed protein product [Musa hybrid cultivar]
MGKTPVRMKAVVYALSPFQQKVMPGLWKDLPGKIHHKVSENWLSATLLLAPIIGTYRCASLCNLAKYPSRMKGASIEDGTWSEYIVFSLGRGQGHELLQRQEQDHVSSLYCLNAYVDLLYVDAVMPNTIWRRRSWNTGTKDDMAFGEFNPLRKVF